MGTGYGPLLATAEIDQEKKMREHETLMEYVRSDIEPRISAWEDSPEIAELSAARADIEPRISALGQPPEIVAQSLAQLSTALADRKSESRVKALAFYLPQYHPIPRTTRGGAKNSPRGEHDQGEALLP